MEGTEDKGIAITLVALALSGIVLVTGHMKSLSMDKSLLEKQLSALAERVTSSKAARQQVDEAFEQREEQVKRVAATEAQYAGLLTDLLELAKVDADAKQVVQKWKIQASGNAQTGATNGDSRQAAPPADGRSSRSAPSGSAPQKPEAGNWLSSLNLASLIEDPCWSSGKVSGASTRSVRGRSIHFGKLASGGSSAGLPRRFR